MSTLVFETILGLERVHDKQNEHNIPKFIPVKVPLFVATPSLKEFYALVVLQPNSCCIKVCCSIVEDTS